MKDIKIKDIPSKTKVPVKTNLLEDPNFKDLKKIFNGDDSDRFKIFSPRSDRYTMIVRREKGNKNTPASFKKNLLCMIDKDSVRINEHFDNAQFRYEAALFAERIGKTSYLFKITEADYNSMWIGGFQSVPNWRIKNKIKVKEKVRSDVLYTRFGSAQIQDSLNIRFVNILDL